MNRRSIINLLSALTLATAGALRAEPTPPAKAPASTGFTGVLRWENGDTLPGGAVGATATEVRWKTPIFETPLSVRWDALSRVDQTVANTAPPDPFGIALRDGSYLHGDLVAMTDASVTIRSARFGEAALKRGEIRSIRRLRGDNLVLAGPSGDVGWNMLSKRPNTPEAKRMPMPATPATTVPSVLGTESGFLSLPYYNRGAYLDLALPERVDAEFHVRAKARPDFQFTLESDPHKGALRVETWGDQLVLTAADQFCIIRKLDDEQKEVALRVCWDRKERRCLVYTSAGEPLAEWQVPENSASTRAGLTLLNKGRDLALEFLRVRAWDGQPLAQVESTQPRIELKDGRILQGEIAEISPDGIRMRAGGQLDPDARLAVGDLDAIDLPVEPAAPAEFPMKLTFADGTLLHGQIVGIKDGAASVATPGAAEPLTVRLTDARQLRIMSPGAPGPALAEMDTLVVAQTTLHGKLVCAGGPTPQWLPVGGTTPAVLAKTADCEIDRAFPPDADIAAPAALLFTSGGDVLPGQLHAIDRSGAEFESGLFPFKKLASNNLEAVELRPVMQPRLAGFTGPGWQVLKGDEKTVKRNGESLKMDPETSIGNPSGMQGSEVSFSMDAGSYCAVRVRLFCAGVDPKGTTNLVLMASGNEIYAGTENAESQLEDRTDTPCDGKRVAVRLVLSERAVELYLDDMSVQKFAVEPSKRPGSGLIIEPGSMWGNAVRPISLSNFATARKPGEIPAAAVNPEAKTQALSVPRFLKDSAPRHALIAANGDVLRGEIEAMTKNHLAFRMALENLNVPIDRVQAAVWLKEASATELPIEKPTPAKLLDQRVARRASFRGVMLKIVQDFLQQSVPGLVVKIPEDERDHTADVQFGGQTLGAMLDRICTAFKLSYRIEDENTVVLERKKPGSDASARLVGRTYWLNAAALPLPAGGSVKDFFSAKQVSFPKGAAVRWQEGARELAMNNTEENHRRLVELVEKELGGVAGSPTHWLILANGARFGLAVDRFDADTVVGHHALYGECRVPVADVYAIRTSAPAQSAAVKSLQDWRLVHAPEPVLPDAGGESTPLLGKDAKGFKLPLLGGGEFELGKEKGHVVVLDFWATWCGPCIKSLPGLIEAVSAFPADQVKLVALNQAESEDQVKRFLETRGWKLTVAMDAGQSVAGQYGVDGIPHTVVVGPDGKVAWVKTGYSADGEEEFTNAVKKLLDPTQGSGAGAKESTAQ